MLWLENPAALQVVLQAGPILQGSVTKQLARKYHQGLQAVAQVIFVLVRKHALSFISLFVW